MKQLLSYLRENMILDFQGDLTMEMIRDFLREDDSRESRALMAKLVEDRGVSEMMIVLADILIESIRKNVTDEILREQLRAYAES